MLSSRSLMVALVGALPLSAHAGEKTLLGVLEQPQCKDGSGIYVRALYVKNNGVWQPLDTAAASTGLIPSKATWSVSYHGKRLGYVETNDPGFIGKYDWTYPRDRLLSVVPGPEVPSVGNQSEDFAGWCGAPKTRPLVATIRGGTSDPNNWQPFLPPIKYISKLFAEFQTHTGEAFICPNPNADSGVHFEYREKDLRIANGYKNTKGQLLVTIGFKPRKDRCDGPDAGWNTQTFLLSIKTTYVGSNLTYVDGGDYDGDGTSEILFWYSGYNKDGYVLLSPSADSHIEYLWNYH